MTAVPLPPLAGKAGMGAFDFSVEPNRPHLNPPPQAGEEVAAKGLVLGSFPKI